jgi:hypothetical protein
MVNLNLINILTNKITLLINNLIKIPKYLIKIFILGIKFLLIIFIIIIELVYILVKNYFVWLFGEINQYNLTSKIVLAILLFILFVKIIF